MVVDEAGTCSESQGQLIVQFDLDKINQWGHEFRDSYTRLGLLKPFMADNAAIYCLTGTATEEDIKVAI